MRLLPRWALAPLAVILLAGCGGQGAKTETATAKAEPSARTLAAIVADDPLGRVAANAGLAATLEGVGPYTVFAPPQAALKAPDFADPAMKAEAAALLRAHIVPGAVTRADITAAVDKAGAKGAKMRTMADTLLTFTKVGSAIVATAPDGAAARLTGDERLASNGVVQPVDGLLVKPGQ